MTTESNMPAIREFEYLGDAEGTLLAAVRAMPLPAPLPCGCPTPAEMAWESALYPYIREVERSARAEAVRQRDEAIALLRRSERRIESGWRVKPDIRAFHSNFPEEDA